MSRVKTKKRMETRKRYWSDCCKCSASFDADRREDTQKKCRCGETLAWNDSAELRVLEGVR